MADLDTGAAPQPPSPWERLFPFIHHSEEGLSTPSTYATPAQVKSQRELAGLLMGREKGGAQQDVHHWTQGLSNMANTLVGSMLMNRATENERRNQLITGGATTPGFGIPPDEAVGPSATSGATPRSSAAEPYTGQYADLYKQKEEEYGLPTGYLSTTAGIESSHNPNNRNEFSNAKGLFQFVPGTAKLYGIKGREYDPVVNTDAAARFARDNMAKLRAAGIEPTAANLYLAHQQGPGGATALLRNPNAPAGSLWKGANRAIAANAGDPTAPAINFTNHWASRFPAGGVKTASAAPTAPVTAGGTPTAAAPETAPAATAGPTKVASLGGIPESTTAALDQGAAAARALGPEGGMTIGAAPQGTQVAGGPPRAGTTAPGMAGGGTTVPVGPVPPGLLPQRPYITAQQLRQIMMAPAEIIPWEEKMMYQKMYNDQHQPIPFTDPYGRAGFANPRNPSEQRIITPIEKSETTIGPIKKPIWTVPTPGVNPSTGVPDIQRLTPPGTEEITGVPAPTAPSEQPPALDLTPKPPAPYKPPEATTPAPAKPAEPVKPTVVPAETEAAPARPKNWDKLSPAQRERWQKLYDADHPKTEKGSEAAPPVRTAALETGNLSDAPAPGMGALSTPPPKEAALTATGQPTPATSPLSPASPQIQTAQAGGLPSGISPQDAAEYNWVQRQEINKTLTEEEGKEDIKNFNEAVKTTQAQTRAALNLKPQLDEMTALINDPRLRQGPGSEVMNMVDWLASALGNKGATEQYGKMQAFNKTVAGSILSEMRSKLEKLGQVRVAELELLQKAAPHQYNTVAANRLILDMAKRYQAQLVEIGRLTDAYKMGARFDNNWKQTNTGERGTAAGLDALVNRYIKDHPLYSDEEIYGNKEKGIPSLLGVFEADKKAGEKGTKRGGMLNTAPPVTEK